MSSPSAPYSRTQALPPIASPQAVSGSVTVSNVITNTPSVATAAALTNVNDTAANVTLLAANVARRMAAIFNDSTEALFVKFGATASLTSFTVKIAAGGYYEFPFPIYVGIVDGIWAADAAGAARITEIT